MAQRPSRGLGRAPSRQKAQRVVRRGGVGEGKGGEQKARRVDEGRVGEGGGAEAEMRRGKGGGVRSEAATRKQKGKRSMARAARDTPEEERQCSPPRQRGIGPARQTARWKFPHRAHVARAPAAHAAARFTACTCAKVGRQSSHQHSAFTQRVPSAGELR
ncbi:hypothetical protein FGB62_65g00 [Gracilaria domingensis]|nr:hypothetical protein FGB62_65g00 [Gracilaria domingensis]